MRVERGKTRFTGEAKAAVAGLDLGDDGDTAGLAHAFALFQALVPAWRAISTGCNRIRIHSVGCI
jgi:hypothetical protein